MGAVVKDHHRWTRDITVGKATPFSISLTDTLSSTIIIKSDGAAAPTFELRGQSQESTGSPIFNFVAQRDTDTASQDGDSTGVINFKGYDDGTPTEQTFAAINSEVHDATSGEESGKLEFKVASHDGGLEEGLVLTGGSQDAEVDVTIGKGSDSITNIVGDMRISGDSIAGAAALTISSGVGDVGLSGNRHVLLDCGSGAGLINMTKDGGTYTPGSANEATPKHYVDGHQMHSVQDNYIFKTETSGRTYFKDIDAVYDDHEWIGYDSEDTTTVGDTISISVQNAITGLIVPYNCKLKGVRWVGYQSQNYAQQVHLQTFTGSSVPDDTGGTTSVTATLRSTFDLVDYTRKYYNKSEALDIQMSAGQMIYPAFQYVSGTAVQYQGSVIYLLERA